MPWYKQSMKGYSAKRQGVPKGFRKAARAMHKYSPGIDKALAGVASLRKLINVEFLTHDTSSSITFNNSNSNANMILLSGMAQGDGQGGRTGISILAKSLSIRAHLTMHASASNTRCRILLIRDNWKDPDNITEPKYTDVYDSTSLNSFRLITSAGRFTKLWEREYTLTTAVQEQAILRGGVTLNHHIKYNSSTATGLGKGALYLLVLSNESINLPTLTYKTRMKYIDN